MKQILSLILVLLLLTGCGANTPAAEEPAAAPETVAEPEKTAEAESKEEPAELVLAPFSAQTLTGETVTEAIYAEAELTVINVWATYCGPCKQEMPVLGMLDRELEDVQILGIVTDVIDQNGDPDPDQVDLALELTEAAACEYPNLILNESLAYLGFGDISAVPATLFVDSEGVVIGRGFYGALDEETWRQTINERLEQVKNE